MLRILHSADWHTRDKDIEEAEKHLGYLVETARHEDVDLIIIAGDTFDSQDIKLDSKAAKLVVKTVSALADIAPVAIVLGTPTHDGKAAEILRFVRGKFDVHVSSLPQQLYLYQSAFYERMIGNIKPEATLSLIPTPTKQFLQVDDSEISQAMSAIFAGFGVSASQYKSPHVLVTHLNITGARLSNNQILIGKDIETGQDQLLLSGAHLILCGHLHYPQQIGDNIFYSGSLYPNNYGETHKHGFYIHEIIEG